MMILQDLRNYYNKRTEFFQTVHPKDYYSTSETFRQYIQKILTGAHNVSDNSAEVSVCLTRIAFLGQY